MKVGRFLGKLSTARNAPDSLRVDERFDSLEAWLAYAGANPNVLRTSANDAVARRIVQNGFIEPFTNRRVSRQEIAAVTGNWREELLANGLNARMRASLLLLAEYLETYDARAVRIFATEAVTSLALILRGTFPKFLGAEYAMDDAAEHEIFPIPHEDLMALSLPSDVFDLVTTNEVLEHVPDLDRGLHEIARVLKPGGWHIGTHPFRFSEESGDLRSRLVDGKIVHLKEPEIHGNPVDPTGGSLVFETPGWNIVSRARAAGFQQAFMRFVASERYGIVTQNTGVFVFCAQK